MKYPVVAYGLDPTIALDPVTLKFTDGVVGVKPASKDRAADMNQVFDELQAVIVDGGIVPDETVFTQVRDAIRAMIAARANSANHFIDPCCRVARGPTALALSTARQYGQVDYVKAWCSVGAVTAGTIVQDTAGNGGGRTPYSVKLAGVTLTGAGAALSWARYLMAPDAQDYVNGPCIVACTIKQSTGGALNMSFAVNKANALNNFGGGVTVIANSGNIAVPNGVATRVSFPIANMGACGNGIEVIPTLVTGPVGVANDFYITDFQISPSTVLGTFEIPKYAVDRAAANWLLEMTYEDGTPAGTATGSGAVDFYLGGTVGAGAVFGTFRHILAKPVVPAVTVYSDSGASGFIHDISGPGNKAVTTTPDKSVVAITSTGALVDGDHFRFHYVVDARP